MIDPVKIVILRYPSNNHIYRHDFISTQKAEEFYRTFNNLRTLKELAISEIEVFIYNSVDEMPEEYRNEEPINEY